MTLNNLRPEIRQAVEAAQEKQAVDITVLKLAGGAFAESQKDPQSVSKSSEIAIDRRGNGERARGGHAPIYITL